jgi:hypothetical protein
VIVPQMLTEEVKRKGVLRPEDYFTPSWSIIAPRPAPGAR